MGRFLVIAYMLCALSGCAHLQKIEQRVESLCDHVAAVDESLAPMLLAAAADPTIPPVMREAFLVSAKAIVAMHDLCFKDPDELQRVRKARFVSTSGASLQREDAGVRPLSPFVGDAGVGTR